MPSTETGARGDEGIPCVYSYCFCYSSDDVIFEFSVFVWVLDSSFYFSGNRQTTFFLNIEVFLGFSPILFPLLIPVLIPELGK